MVNRRLIILLLLLLPGVIQAQTGYVTGTVLDGLGNVVGGAQITVCPQGSPGIPCSPVTASTTSNGQGAFSVGVPLGTYTVTVFRTGIVSTSSTIVVAPSNITIGSSVTYNGAVTFNNNATVAGTLTVSGTGTFTGALNAINLNDILWVGTNGYANIAAAETAAGSTNKTIIGIRSTYAGTDCPVASTNRVVWDFRGTSAAAACNQNTIGYNTDDGNVRAMVKAQQNLSTIDAAGSNVGHWLLSVYNNGATGNLVEGASTESVIGGTFAANTLTLLQGNESAASVQSTGGTVTNAVGVNGYVNNTLGSTTAITTAIGVKGTGCNGTLASTTKPTNCYGGYFLDQFSIGGGKNYALAFEGPARAIWSSTDGFAGMDLDDNSAVPHPFVRMLSGDNTSAVQAINTNGLSLRSSDGTTQENITTGGVGVTLIQNVAHTQTMGFTLKKGSGAGNYTNATTSYTVADSANLCYTITIPTGWKLGISASGALSTATAAVVAQAALTDNAACSTANAGILVETAPIQGAAIGVADAFGLNWVITGDGASHNIALQFKTSNAADTASLINSSATITPTMKFTLMPSN